MRLGAAERPNASSIRCPSASRVVRGDALLPLGCCVGAWCAWGLLFYALRAFVILIARRSTAARKRNCLSDCPA